MGDHERVHVYPIKVQKSPILVQQENVLKEETPSEARDRQSPNFVQRDICVSSLCEFVDPQKV